MDQEQGATRIEDREALYLSYSVRRLGNNGIDRIVLKAGARVGLHDTEATKSENFTVHCARHFFLQLAWQDQECHAILSKS